jgi:hypothetical protein
MIDQRRARQMRKSQIISILALAISPPKVRLYGCQKGGRKFGKHCP